MRKGACETSPRGRDAAPSASVSKPVVSSLIRPRKGCYALVIWVWNSRFLFTLLKHVEIAAIAQVARPWRRSSQGSSCRLTEETVCQRNRRAKCAVINASSNSNRLARPVVPEELNFDLVGCTTGSANLASLHVLIPYQLRKL